MVWVLHAISGRLLGMSRSSEPPRVALVVLAAGGGSRFHGATHKLLAPFRGTTVVDSAIDNALASQCGPVIVVTGAIDLPSPRTDVTIVKNLQWASGQRSSLLAALAAVESMDVDAIVIGLGDQPMISPSAWAAVAVAPGPLVVATYDGIRAQPVKLHRSLWDEVRNGPDEPDEGLKSFIRLRTQLVTELACEGSPADIDTEEDLSRWT